MDPQLNIWEEGKKEIERKPLDGFGNCGRNPFFIMQCKLKLDIY
jgi:hypothetical protein